MTSSSTFNKIMSRFGRNKSIVGGNNKMGIRENPDYSPLLTDFYQVTMAFSYYQQGRHEEPASFDVFYRKSPFKGHYTLFFGASDVKKYAESFFVTEEEADYILQNLGMAKNHDFKKYLMSLREEAAKVKFDHLPEGSVCFPKVPVMRVSGPLGVVQLMETAILALTGFSSLVATNASRICAASKGRKVLEFGLRRAQGPNGALTASKYAVLGGCSGTSNVLAGFRDGLSISGTMAHSYICGFQHTSGDLDFDSFKTAKRKLNPAEFPALVRRIKEICEVEKLPGTEWASKVAPPSDSFWGNSEETRERWHKLRATELNAFIAYALDFPHNFLALVDTYHTLNSGCANFLYTSLALIIYGETPKGIRLDSGDLAKLAEDSRAMFAYFLSDVAPGVVEVLRNEKVNLKKSNHEEYFREGSEKRFAIVASNDLHEDAVKDLMKKTNGNLEIDLFGIGTHLATCKAQPALGMVYKLVEVGEEKNPCVKFSQDEIKQTYPGKKNAFRLYQDGVPVGDVLSLESEDEEKVNNMTEFYSNQDFTNSVPVKFDSCYNLYKDEFTNLLGGSENVDSMLAKCKDKEEFLKAIKGQDAGANPVSKKLQELLVQKLGTTGPAGKIGEVNLLKAYTEARKAMFPTQMLDAKVNDGFEFQHTVYLTKNLRNALKKFRGEAEA